MKWHLKLGDNLLIFILRVIVGSVFVFAGALKVFDPVGFAGDVGNFRMVPHALLNLFVIILPWVEVGAGLLLVLGVWVRASSVVVALMTVMFLIAISQAIARGLDIRCGCFGTVDSGKVGWRKLAEDTGLLAMTLWLWWRAKK